MQQDLCGVYTGEQSAPAVRSLHSNGELEKHMVSTAQQSRTHHRAPEIWAASCCRASPEDQLDVLCPSSTPVAPRLPSSSSGVFCLTVCPGHSILVLAVNFQECTSCTPRLTAEDRFLNLSSFPLFLLLRAGWSGWGRLLR